MTDGWTVVDKYRIALLKKLFDIIKIILQMTHFAICLDQGEDDNNA